MSLKVEAGQSTKETKRHSGNLKTSSCKRGNGAVENQMLHVITIQSVRQLPLMRLLLKMYTACC